MIGHRFVHFDPNENSKSKFEQLLDIFMQLLTYTSGNAAEALDWLNQLDNQYKLTDDEYGMGDFIDDLKQNGYLAENEQDGSFSITGKSEQTIRKKSLEEIFGKLKKANRATTRHLNRGRAMK
jgi:Ca-activated chloride channel family protein